MKPEDILVGDHRVTVLDETGQYMFEWIDKESQIVSFIEKESDFDDYTNEVVELLQNVEGIEIQDESNNKSINNSNKNGKNQDEKDDIQTVADNHKSTSNNKNKSESQDRFVSFIVRMNDTTERQNAVNNSVLPDFAIDKMGLTGPFRVTYRVSTDDIHLYEVEDLGIDSSTKRS